MPARIYPSGVQYILEPSTSWEDLTVRAVLVTQLFEYDSSDQLLSDLNPSHLVATSNPLENATLSASLIADGDPFEWTAFLSTLEVTGVVLYADYGDEAYSPLLAYYPSDDLIGVPLVPGGLQLFLYPSAELNGFFQLFEEDVGGMLGTTILGSSDFSLSELEGGLTAAFPDLLLSGTLSNRDKACMPADVDNSCCAPEIRSTLCG